MLRSRPPIRHLLIGLLVGLLCLAAGLAHAQTVAAGATLQWTNPTTTPGNALTAIEVHWSTAPIADADLTRAPQATLTGSPATSTHTISVTNGQTLYFRLRAVNATGKSAYSNQASKLVDVAMPPGVPSSLTVTIVVGS